ncbi:quinone oxidoreductase PIG3-like isoform X2 [Apostichopus japonicus]|uniref:quinone oxidoreductase PIG3-like isoform X2 n=1 Tax=Stichopus japonicus TaxID=307972 RepID=UPI003AB4DA54
MAKGKMDLSSSSEVSSNFISSFQTPVNNVKFDCQLAENFGYVYTAESVKEVQNRWQALTSSKFVCIKTTKGYGKNDFDDLLKHNLQWELPSLGSAGMGNKGLDYDGMPFVIIATKVLDCQHGVDRHLKRKLVTDNIRNQKQFTEGRKRFRSSNKECKKVDCPAQLLVKDVIKFPDFRIGDKTDAKKAAVSRKLRQSLESNKNVVGERRYYLRLPLPSEHNGHPLMESSAMKAVQQANPGDADTLFIDGVHPRPEPKDREIVIEVFNSAVNRLDILQRKGALPVPKGASPIIGLEVSGRVHKLGPKCSDKWKEDDRVMALVNGGGYAEYTTVDEDHVMAIPDHMTFTEAAAVPEVWLTAYQLLHLIGGSGVGTAAVQLVVSAGAHAIVTAGSQEKIDKALSLGATAGVNYKVEEFHEKVAELTEGKGVNIILDCVGSSYWSKNLEALAMDGRWVLYGLLGGPNVKGNFLGGLLRKRATLSATTLRTRTDQYKAHLIEEFTANALPLFGRSEQSQLKVVVDKVFPLASIQEAHQYVEGSKNIGKVVLEIKRDEGEVPPEADCDENVVTEEAAAHSDL